MHQRLHNNERPFACGTCSKSYISGSGLRTHWKSSKCGQTKTAFESLKEFLLVEQVLYTFYFVILLFSNALLIRAIKDLCPQNNVSPLPLQSSRITEGRR